MKELNFSISEINKPRQKEAKALIIKIENSFLNFRFPNLLEILNLVLAPRIAPRETKKISSTD